MPAHPACRSVVKTPPGKTWDDLGEVRASLSPRSASGHRGGTSDAAYPPPGVTAVHHCMYFGSRPWITLK
jgi:hypothetical protein